jgi:cytoskeletal protein CcmA (bactofilin family)
METAHKHDLRISGAGSAGGGVYHHVVISGAGKIRGDVEAELIKISGAGQVSGHVRANMLEASGAFTLTGDLDTGLCTCSGAGKIGGNVKAGTMRISGAVHVGGNLKGGEVIVSGGCKLGGDVEAEHFRAGGGLEIGGLLSADTVEIALAGHGRVREIGGERIIVLSARQQGDLRTESVEGDEVYLEQTQANAVRGRQVVIGPGCRIDQVAYSESLQIDPQAQVGQSTYTGSAVPASPVITTPAQRPQGWPGSERLPINGWSPHWAVNNLFGKAIAGVVALVVVVIVIGAVCFIVLPIVGVIVGSVLSVVGLLLLVLAIIVPLIIVGAIWKGVFWSRGRSGRPRRR